MRLSNEKGPLLLGKRLQLVRTIQAFGGAGTSVAEGACVAGIAEHFEDRAVEQGRPVDLPGMRTRADAARKEQTLVPKILHCGSSRPCAFERREQDT
jgi:hypothetical protein